MPAIKDNLMDENWRDQSVSISHNTFNRGFFGLFLKIIAWTLFGLILAGLLWNIQHFC